MLICSTQRNSWSLALNDSELYEVLKPDNCTISRKGQTVKKPQGFSGKTSPGGKAEAKGFSEGKP